MAINTDKNKIEEILSRGVEEVFVKKHLENQLKSGKKLRIKHGVDPTGPKIHIGRATQLWKLAQFQDLGHKIVLIIGDFTAQIGDASDKQAVRKVLTEKEIKNNMKDYAKQIDKILDMKKVELRHNSEWLGKLSAKNILELSMHFTAQQMIQRRNFKERWDKGKPIGLHELDYPLLQGYDSVAVKADVELGGFDQLFNLKRGRDIQKIFKQKPQDIMTLKMVDGLDGRKMSTSWGNVINILDAPNEMFGKIMSMRDELIGQYFELCAGLAITEIEKIKTQIEQGVNPRDLKAKLGREIVKMYHGEKQAQKAGAEFNKIFRDKEMPTKIPEFKVVNSKKNYPILDLIKDSGLAESKSKAKQLIEGRGVAIDAQIQTDWQKSVEIKNNMVIKAGKRKFVKIKLAG